MVPDCADKLRLLIRLLHPQLLWLLVKFLCKDIRVFDREPAKDFISEAMRMVAISISTKKSPRFPVSMFSRMNAPSGMMRLSEISGLAT